MSNNVFGVPVTDSTVKIVMVGVTNITAAHRAEVALLHMNEKSIADEARAFVADLKRRYGRGTSTLCAVYNATGNNLSFVRSHTWGGHVWSSPYPPLIQNGQWAAFLHVSGSSSRSKEAVVYRGLNLDGTSRDWVLAWNTSSGNNQNRVYTEVRANTATINWNTVDSNMERNLANHLVTTLGCFSSVAVGAGSSPHFTAIMSLQGVARDATDVSKIFPSLDSEEHLDDDETPAADAVATSTN